MINGSTGDEDDLRRRWEKLLEEADIQTVPFNFLKSISVKMLDGTVEDFDIEELVASGLTVKQVEKLVHYFLETNDEEIDTLDFHLNVEIIANTVEQKTKRLLGD